MGWIGACSVACTDTELCFKLFTPHISQEKVLPQSTVDACFPKPVYYLSECDIV